MNCEHAGMGAEWLELKYVKRKNESQPGWDIGATRGANRFIKVFQHSHVEISWKSAVVDIKTLIVLLLLL